MKTRAIPAFAAGLTTILLATAGSASAIGSNDFNGVFQGVIGLAVSDATFENDYDADLGGGNAHAAANCQWLVAFNAVTVNMAAAEGLGVIDQDDSIEIALPTGIDSIDFRTNDRQANATCSQEIGTYRIVDSHSSGWGEAAPQSAGLGSLWSGWFGGGDENVVEQIAIGAAVFSGTVKNDADIEMRGGNAHASANCQFLTAANLLSVNTATAGADARITDDNSVLIGTPVAGASEYQRGADVTINLQHREANATCSQVVDTFELIIGDDRDNDDES